MKNSILIAFIFVCISATSQSNDSIKAASIDVDFSPTLTGEVFYEFVQYAGEQFFNKEWTKSDILLSNGELLTDKKIKYNGLLDEVIWFNTTSFSKVKLDKLSINEFWIKNSSVDKVHFKRLTISSIKDLKSTDLFAEVGVEGKLSFYIQHKIVGTGEEEYFMNGRYFLLTSLKEKPLYIIQLPSKEYVVIRKISRNAILKLFPDMKKDISKLIKDNSLTVKTQTDVVRLFELLNSKIFK